VGRRSAAWRESNISKTPMSSRKLPAWHDLAPEVAHADLAIAFGEVGPPRHEARNPLFILLVVRKVVAQERLLAAYGPGVVHGEAQGEEHGCAQHLGAEAEPEPADEGEQVERMPAQGVRPGCDQHFLLPAGNVGEAT
jgi:hypothetical protein